MIKRKCILISFIILTISKSAFAQLAYGTTGLVRMPTADMQIDKTVILGGSFLNKESTPKHWFYNTYNYYINCTFFPFLEISYCLTLNKATNRNWKGDPINYWVPSTYGKFVNQDRMFSVRLRLIKEKQLWKYMPAILIGGNDILTKSWNGGELSIDNSNPESNGYWGRIYIVASKHVKLERAGKIGIHLAYIYNNRADFRYKGVAIGGDLNPILPENTILANLVNNSRLMAEYDSRTFNIALKHQFWKDHINLIVEMVDMKYISGGIFFKIHLK